MTEASSGSGGKRPYEIRDLHFLTRVGLTVLALILLGGLAVSGQYMREHYERRDGVAGVSIDDVRAHYHGVNKIAPMITVLEDPGSSECGAHENVSDSDKQVLLDWLQSVRISADFDNLDLGDAAPAEIIARSCLQCHSRSATEGGTIGQDLPLEYWDDVERVSFSQQVEPTDPEIMLASMHTHSLSMAMILLITTFLAIGTAWPRGFVGLLVCVGAIGLGVDLASWFLARSNDVFVFTIIAGGVCYVGGTGLSLVLVVLDLWRPRFK